MISIKKNEQELTNEVMSKISLSKDKENLEKHVVSLSKCVVDLSKKENIDLGDIKAKVVVALDYSGSMSSLYKNGAVQETINRLVPLGLTFDDNGSIDMYLFQNDYRKMKDVTLSNYENYVKKVNDKSGYHMGGTYYAPVLEAIINTEDNKSNTGFFGKLFGSKNKSAETNSNEITFVLFITDGENSDSSRTDSIIRESSDPKCKTFIQFIGIGDERFSYLKKLDNLSGRKVDNTGFSKMKDLQKASDEELYNNVLEQFSKWLKVV
jgi:uncharacterized protein YciU (UPF0263 family)